MEARQIKLETNFIPKPEELQEEQRLKAIKKILVGNQIERLESRFEGLSTKVDESNGIMMESMNEMKEQLQFLRSELNLKGKNAPKSSSSVADSGTSNLEKALQKLSGVKKESKLAFSDRKTELEKSLEQINKMESDFRESASRKPEISDRYSLNDFQKKLSSKMNTDSNKSFVEQRLADLEAKINRLSPQALDEVEGRLSQRQDRFENETQDLLERLAGRVNERFDFAQNEREALEHRVSAIQDVLENDILGLLKRGGGSVQGYNIERVKADLERTVREQQIRMEAKMEAFMDLSQRQMGRSYEDPKKRALRETLKKLSDLLDE